MKHVASHPTAELADYAEGARTSVPREDLERHLAGCEPCRSEVRAWRELFAGFESLPRARAPRDLSARILAAVAAEPLPARRARVLIPALRMQMVHALTW